MSGWQGPPRMDDMAELAKVGMNVPIETTLRLEALRRELGQRVRKDPTAVAQFGLMMEQCRSMLDRQLRHALMMLAERGDAAEQLAGRVAFLEGRLAQLEKRCARLAAGRRGWWPW